MFVHLTSALLKVLLQQECMVPPPSPTPITLGYLSNLRV